MGRMPEAPERSASACPNALRNPARNSVTTRLWHCSISLSTATRTERACLLPRTLETTL